MTWVTVSSSFCGSAGIDVVTLTQVARGRERAMGRLVMRALPRA